MSSGLDVKTGSRSSAQLIFTTPLRELQCSMSRTKSAGSSLGSSCCRNVIFGWIAVTIERREDLLALLERDAARLPVRREDPRDAGVRPDLGAERPGARLDRRRDRAHPALRHRPRAEVPVADVADRVVRHHVAGARLVRPRPRADQAVQRHHGLHLIGLEEPIEDVHDRHRHQPRDVADRLHVEPAEPPDQPELVDAGPRDASSRPWAAWSSGAGRAPRPGRRSTRPIARSRRRRAWRTWRTRRSSSRSRRTARCSARRGTAGSTARSDARDTRAARAAGRAGSCRASGSSRS